MAFFGVNFILQKFCPCKKNDKYKVCPSSFVRQKKFSQKLPFLSGPWVFCNFIWNDAYSHITISTCGTGFHAEKASEPWCLTLRLDFCTTRPKPAFGRQGLDSDRWARIQFSQVHFGAKTSRYQQGDPTDLLWCKNVTSPTGGSNRPFRCLDEGGRALPKFFYVTNTGPQPTSFGPKNVTSLTRGPNRPPLVQKTLRH